MAFSSLNGGIRTVLSEINVTPMVDVMLVLLVIFMVTAPILQTGIQVNLPHTKSATPINNNSKMVIITIDRKSNIYLNSGSTASDIQVNINELSSLINQELAKMQETKVYVRADGDVPYRIIAYVLGVCKQSGTVVNLVTDLDDAL